MRSHSFSTQDAAAQSTLENSDAAGLSPRLSDGIQFQNRDNYDYQRMAAANMQSSGDRLVRENVLPQVELNNRGASGDGERYSEGVTRTQGATMHRDASGRIDAIASDNGASRNFRYDSNGELQAVNYTMPNGRDGHLERTPHGWRQSVQTAHGVRHAMLRDVDVDQETGEVKLTMNDDRGTRYWRPDNTMSLTPGGSSHDRSIRPMSAARADGADRLVQPSSSETQDAQDSQSQSEQQTHYEPQAQTENQESQNYTIQAGDSLWAIASRELSEGGGHPTPRQIMNEINRLAKLNNITNPNKIQAGQQIKMH